MNTKRDMAERIAERCGYNLARESKSYGRFCESLKEIGGEIAFQTPDGVAWNDSGLDKTAIDEYFDEL